MPTTCPECEWDSNKCKCPPKKDKRVTCLVCDKPVHVSERMAIASSKFGTGFIHGKCIDGYCKLTKEK